MLDGHDNINVVGLGGLDLLCTLPSNYGIDLLVSPTPRTQTSQWQLSISCIGSNSDSDDSVIFRFQCYRETLEDAKLAYVLWSLCFKNGKNDVPGILVTRYL